MIFFPGRKKSQDLIKVGLFLSVFSLPACEFFNASLYGSDDTIIAEQENPFDRREPVDPTDPRVTEIDLKKELNRDQDVYVIARADLQDIVRNGEDPTRYRYISFANLNNGVNDAGLIWQHQNALGKLVNSLSWNPTLTFPAKVRGSNVLYRINLNDYDWSLEDWQRVEQDYATDLSTNPGVSSADTEIDPSRLDIATQVEIGRMKDLTQTAIPLMHGDEFIHIIAQPQVYHQLGKIPADITNLESLLGIDVLTNVYNQRALRAAFVESGVSNNNRMIERHNANFGAYWKSYDFGENAGDQNVISLPLGPIDVNNPFDSDSQFRHLGGEVIFNLPNGLQAYALIDESNNRIDVAPTAIVQDFERDDFTVHNGISCLSCHSRGMNRNTDEVRAFALQNPNLFSPGDYDGIMGMYASSNRLNATFDADDRIFKQAMEQLNLDVTDPEPIGYAFYLYEEPVNSAEIAHDMGVQESLLLATINSSPELLDVFGFVVQPGNYISREDYQANFRLLYEQIKNPQ